MKFSFRTLLAVAVAGAVALGTISVAQADVIVRAKVKTYKKKFVTEKIYIDKDIFLDVKENIQVDAVAEQDIVKNQRNQWTLVEDEFGVSSAVIGKGAPDDAGAQLGDAVGTGAKGILLFNQSPGYANNQGNEVSVTYAQTPDAVVEPDPDPDPAGVNGGVNGHGSVYKYTGDGGVMVHATAAVEQINGWEHTVTYVEVCDNGNGCVARLSLPFKDSRPISGTR